jgi:hypothetical protein
MVVVSFSNVIAASGDAPADVIGGGLAAARTSKKGVMQCRMDVVLRSPMVLETLGQPMSICLAV